MSVTDMQNAVAMSSKNLTEAQIGLSEKIGALKAMNFFKKLLTVSEIKMLAELKETKQYKGFQLFDSEGKLLTVSTWAEFCSSIGKSFQHIDNKQIIINELNCNIRITGWANYPISGNLKRKRMFISQNGRCRPF